MHRTFLHIKHILVLIAVGLLASCSSTKPATTINVPVERPASGDDESFDPVTLNDEDLSFREEGSNVSTPTQTDTNVDNTPKRRSIDGYRVQLFASKEIDKATQEKKEAEFVFNSDGIGVYIEFDSPMYKVRIGDCATRDAAEELREVARKRGYPTSWIVKAKVSAARAGRN